MGVIKNLLGQKFGRLSVVKFSHVKRRAFWKCLCDCGNSLTIHSKDLMNGNTKSCGCYKIERPTLEASGANSPNWKGEKVQYRALHTHMYKKVLKPKNCTFCKEDKKLNLANISQKYKYDKNDWMWLCGQCHARYDKGWIFKKGKWFKKCKGCKITLEVNKQNFYLRTSGKWVFNCKKCSKGKH